MSEHVKPFGNVDDLFLLWLAAENSECAQVLWSKTPVSSAGRAPSPEVRSTLYIVLCHKTTSKYYKYYGFFPKLQQESPRFNPCPIKTGGRTGEASVGINPYPMTGSIQAQKYFVCVCVSGRCHDGWNLVGSQFEPYPDITCQAKLLLFIGMLFP